MSQNIDSRSSSSFPSSSSSTTNSNPNPHTSSSSSPPASHSSSSSRPLSTSNSASSSSASASSSSLPSSPSKPVTAHSSSGSSSSTTSHPLTPDGKHRLASGFTFWYLNKSVSGAHETYESSIKHMCTFSTVEDFWANYTHLIRPHELPTTVIYHLFREGIQPLWEDSANARGGKWLIRLKKGCASRIWEELILALIGDAFGLGDQVCGIVLVTKFNEDVVSIWNRDANNKQVMMKIRDTIKSLLDISTNNALEYRPHDESMKNLTHLNPLQSKQGP